MFHTRDALVEVLRVKAREVGGDALIGFADESRVTGASPAVNGGVDLDRQLILSGTIIRFKSMECAE
jgi:hypothetical protein